ncbi:MAG: hypothetical protein NXI21_19100 [Alphaproteobacteria bacterium]|nr:hypothetical protein [Alphaproteobacteria bacterium]
MPRPRYSPPPTACVSGEAFTDVETAWCWAVEASDSAAAGARFRAERSLAPRPCDPRDIMGVAARLLRARKLSRRQLGVMLHYARRAAPPDPRVPEEREALGQWRAGLQALEPPLIRKGIVADDGSSFREPAFVTAP